MRDTTWFADSGWGVFCHYLTTPDMTAEEWNRQVDAFDVEGLAAQLAGIGAPYFFITLGQNSGHYCAPNAAYEAVVGSPGKCARRDLVSELSAALAPHGVPLCVYLPSGAPAADPIAMQRLEWQWGFVGEWPEAWGGERTGLRLAAFQRKWEAVIREWSLRWGTKVRGWWFDGCYFADEMYRHADEPNFLSFAAAARTGNPEALVAFNPGVEVEITAFTPAEDYTAGEMNDAETVTCTGRWLNGEQWHMFSFLGPFWGQSPPRYRDEQAIAITRRIIAHGGVVTWDVPITEHGLIPEEFAQQLRQIALGVRSTGGQ